MLKDFQLKVHSLIDEFKTSIKFKLNLDKNIILILNKIEYSINLINDENIEEIQKIIKEYLFYLVSFKEAEEQINYFNYEFDDTDLELVEESVAYTFDRLQSIEKENPLFFEKYYFFKYICLIHKQSFRFCTNIIDLNKMTLCYYQYLIPTKILLQLIDLIHEFILKLTNNDSEYFKTICLSIKEICCEINKIEDICLSIVTSFQKCKYISDDIKLSIILPYMFDQSNLIDNII